MLSEEHIFIISNINMLTISYNNTDLQFALHGGGNFDSLSKETDILISIYCIYLYKI